jgi:hypothetical protein
MQMPGKVYGALSRYGHNGQERSTELNKNSYTAEYWQYDSRIVRRWNVDPKPNISLSPYNAFEGNPIFNRDPLGDTSYPTPDGGTLNILGDKAETFDGKAHKAGNSSTTVQPAAGTLQSFTSGSQRFVATFGATTGKFLGYYNAKNLNQSFGSYIADLREQGLEMLKAEEAVSEFERMGIWDRDLTDDQAKRRLIGFGLGGTLPNAIIKPLTIATAVNKVTNSTVGRSVAEFVNLFKPIDDLDFTKTLYRGLTGFEEGKTVIHLTDDAAVAATYAQKGYEVMKYQMTQFSLKSLEFSKDLRYATGIHGPTGKVSTEYIFEGKKLVEAINSIAKPLNQ